jgi:hypothetical protein
MADDIQELNALVKDFIKSAEGGAVPKVKPFLTGREVGTTSEGRPLIQNTQGSLSSELSITTEDPRTPGNYINIPSIYYGKVLSDDQALRLIMDSGYRDPMTGRAINSYPSVEEAVSAAQARSDAIQYAEGGSVSGADASVRPASEFGLSDLLGRVLREGLPANASATIQSLYARALGRPAPVFGADMFTDSQLELIRDMAAVRKEAGYEDVVNFEYPDTPSRAQWRSYNGPGSDTYGIGEMAGLLFNDERYFTDQHRRLPDT